MRIVVGVMVAPRPVETVGITLRSLAAAGFASVTYFAEPGEYEFEKEKRFVIKRPHIYSHEHQPEFTPSPGGQFGNFQNFVQSIRDLLLIDSSADAVMIVEDDALFCKNFRPLIEKGLAAPHCGLLSLYAPNIRKFFDKEEVGLRVVTRKLFFGGVALVMPRGVAEEISQQSSILEWPGGRRQPVGIPPWEREASDAWIGRAVRALGRVIYCWNPSLALHYTPQPNAESNSSRTDRGGPHTGPRQAKNFIGEGTDAVEFFKDHEE